MNPLAPVRRAVAHGRRRAQQRRGSAIEPEVTAETAPATMFPEERWFADHIAAAREVIGDLDRYGRPLRDRCVADVGTGDGIIALGLAVESGLRELVAYDLNPTDQDRLLDLARTNQYVEDLPPNLRFESSMPDRVPAADGCFDVVVSWSCFEHVSQPLAMALELRRIVRIDGLLLLQLWPFYYSEHGSHLFDWYQGGFPHLTLSAEQIRNRLLREDPRPHSEYIWGEYQTLNKVTVDELAAALTTAGFRIAHAELLTVPTTLPESVADLPLSHLLVAGVKLIAHPR